MQRLTTTKAIAEGRHGNNTAVDSGHHSSQCGSNENGGNNGGQPAQNNAEEGAGALGTVLGGTISADEGEYYSQRRH